MVKLEYRGFWESINMVQVCLCVCTRARVFTSILDYRIQCRQMVKTDRQMILSVSFYRPNTQINYLFLMRASSTWRTLMYATYWDALRQSPEYVSEIKDTWGEFRSLPVHMPVSTSQTVMQSAHHLGSYCVKAIIPWCGVKIPQVTGHTSVASG